MQSDTEKASDYEKPPAELLELRRSIDNIDTALIHLLSERFKLTGRAGQIKAEQNLPISDRARELQQQGNLCAMASKCGLDPDIAEKIITMIVKEVLHRHQKLRK